MATCTAQDKGCFSDSTVTPQWCRLLCSLRFIHPTDGRCIIEFSAEPAGGGGGGGEGGHSCSTLDIFDVDRSVWAMKTKTNTKPVTTEPLSPCKRRNIETLT